MSCSLLWSGRVSGSQLSRRTVRAKSVRFASSAQAETGEAEAQESQSPGLGDGGSVFPRLKPDVIKDHAEIVATGVIEEDEAGEA